MPGPTGETNRLTMAPREPFLCLGPDHDAQIKAVGRAGGIARKGTPEEAATAQDIAGVLWWGDESTARSLRQVLAGRDGAILPLITETPRACDTLAERHLCIDTTASGGNAALMVEVGA